MGYFSVTAMFIMFREVLEAAVVISVVLQLLNRIGAEPKFKRQAWWGAAAGLALSILFGIIFVAVYYTLDKEVFTGKTESIFEAVVMLIATVMITILAFGMLKIMAMKKRWEARLSNETNIAFSGKKRYAVFLVTFTAVIREGIESVLFLTGVGQGHWKAIPIAGVVGAVLGAVVGYVLFFSLKPINIKWFFYIVTALLLVIAAGLFTRAFHELLEAQAFGPFEVDNKPIPWHNQKAWSICKCCSHDGNNFWGLARALVNYTCDPTYLEIILYLCYWIVLIGVIVYKIVRGTLTEYRSTTEKSDESLTGGGDAEPEVIKAKGEELPANMV